MASVAKQPNGEGNLLWALVIVTVACALAAFATYWICDFVLESFQDSQSMALLLVDGGKVVSDDKKLGDQLTSATVALKTCRDLGLALSIGCVGVGVAVFLRIRRQNAS